MKAENFAFVRDLLRRRSGIVLEESKVYLVQARLGPVVRQLGLDSIDTLIEALRSRPDEEMHREVLEAMITTETSFFRDVHPFETLKDVLIPRLMQERRKSRELFFWSAACASGQEIHSLAMLLREHFPELQSWKLTLLATDVSEEMLGRTREGLYSQLEVNRGLPRPMLEEHFDREDVYWNLHEDVKQRVQPERMNLVGDWPRMEPVDVVFLRNVLLYFDEETRRRVLGRTRDALREDGTLFVGPTETAFCLDGAFERVGDGLYRLRVPPGSIPKSYDYAGHRYVPYTGPVEALIEAVSGGRHGYLRVVIDFQRKSG